MMQLYGGVYSLLRAEFSLGVILCFVYGAVEKCRVGMTSRQNKIKKVDLVFRCSMK